MRTWIPLLIALFIAAAPEPAAGQTGALPPLDAPAELNPGEIQRLFDAMLVADAERALELSDKQYPEFLTRLRALQETRRSNLLQRVKLMAELQRLSNPRNPKPDEATLKERLAALQELESRSAAELRRSYNAIDEVLDLRQQARFRVIEEQLERRKLELLMRARQNRMQQRRQR
jgi:dihydrodipicolinate synthase/N-acetylneuraminate lyase